MSSDERPVIVMVVLNDVTGDARVKKMALTLATAGCSVTVYGFSKGAQRWETALGSVRIIRLPDPLNLSNNASQEVAPHTPRVGACETSIFERAHARHRRGRAKVRRQISSWKSLIDERQAKIDRRGYRSLADRVIIASLWVRIKILRKTASISRLPLVTARLVHSFGSMGDTTIRRIARRVPQPLKPSLFDPFAHVSRFGQLLVDELEGQHVDVIHAHDFFAIGVAHRGATELSTPDAPVRWIYDAHEYVRGLDHFSPGRHQAALELESHHIACADRVITVTPDLADCLQRDYRLSRRPDVVFNAPAVVHGITSQDTVRSILGFADDVPLLVYAGQVKAARDVHTLVAALEHLPQVHLVLLTANVGTYVDGLAKIAEGRSALNRYHTIPYVAPHEVSGFLSDANVGAVPLTHYGNAEVALPTKLFEYMHARLPMVVSNTMAMSRFVTELRIGEVFTAGDPRSLATAVARVLDNPEAYREPMLSDPDLLLQYSWQRQEGVLYDVYNSLLGRRLDWEEGRTPISLREDALSGPLQGLPSPGHE